MQDRVKVAVIFYSATGPVYRLAQAVAGGACDAGAEVRLRKVRELAPPEAMASTGVGSSSLPVTPRRSSYRWGTRTGYRRGGR
jgi:multimeric flavodoxin WrbA